MEKSLESLFVILVFILGYVNIFVAILLIGFFPVYLYFFLSKKGILIKGKVSTLFLCVSILSSIVITVALVITEMSLNMWG